MSLSRIQEFALPYIYNYLDPTGELRQNPVEMDIQCNSVSVTENIFIKEKALNIIMKDGKPEGDMALGSINPRICFGSNFRFVYQDDEDHMLYHKSLDEVEKIHAHLLKGAEKPYQEISTDDLQCILKQIKKVQHLSFVCPPQNPECILTNEDSVKIIQAHDKYLRQQKGIPHLDAAVNLLYSKFEEKCISGGKSFFKAFLDTFLDKYIQPYLINLGLNHTKARWSIEALKSTVSLPFAASLQQAALDLVLRNALDYILTKFNVGVDTRQAVGTESGTILAVMNNPYSLMELGVNGFAAASGQVAAWKLIRALPKLKVDPQETIKDSENPEPVSDISCDSLTRLNLIMNQR